MAIINRNRLVEKFIDVIRQDGLNTNKNVNVGVAGGGSTATLSVGTGGINTTGNIVGTSVSGNNASTGNHTNQAAINSTASATAAQIATGYITSTSGAATTITMPTTTLIAAAIGATAGSTFDFWIDNTAGANTVTLTIDSSQTKSQVAQVATYGVPTFGLFTVASGASGQACFKLAFSSTTAATIARVF